MCIYKTPRPARLSLQHRLGRAVGKNLSLYLTSWDRCHCTGRCAVCSCCERPAAWPRRMWHNMLHRSIRLSSLRLHHCFESAERITMQLVLFHRHGQQDTHRWHYQGVISSQTQCVFASLNWDPYIHRVWLHKCLLSQRQKEDICCGVWERCLPEGF